jgi:hypothetical protein
MSSKNTSPLLSANRAPTLLERPVNKGSSCAPPKVFKALRLQVGEDLKTRNALRPITPLINFRWPTMAVPLAPLWKPKICTGHMQRRRARDCSTDEKGNAVFEATRPSVTRASAD